MTSCTKDADDFSTVVENYLCRRDAASADALLAFIGDDPHSAANAHAKILEVDESLAADIASGFPVRTLVLAVNFPPYNDASAVTAMKRILSEGELVDVVAQDMSAVRDRDDSLWEAVRPYIRWFYGVPTYPAFARWDTITGYVSHAVRALEAKHPNGLPYARIRSRAMFPGAHFLAATLAARNPDLTWEAEFSDPVRMGVDGKARPSIPIPVDGLSQELFLAVHPAFRRALSAERQIFSWCEYLTYGLATTVVFTNHNQREAMLGSAAEISAPWRDSVRERSVVNPHPTLSREWYFRRLPTYQPAKDRLSIGYFGVFYANRGIGEVVAAMAGLEPDEAAKIDLWIHTNKPSAVIDEITSYNFDVQIHVRPFLSFLDFLATIDQFDFLVVSDVLSAGYERNPYLPSKFSDYLGSKAKVWAIVDEGSVLSNHDNDDGRIFRTPLRDITAARQFIRELLASPPLASRDENLFRTETPV